MLNASRLVWLMAPFLTHITIRLSLLNSDCPGGWIPALFRLASPKSPVQNRGIHDSFVTFH